MHMKIFASIFIDLFKHKMMVSFFYLFDRGYMNIIADQLWIKFGFMGALIK